MALARREHDRRKLIRWAGGATTIQRQARSGLEWIDQKTSETKNRCWYCVPKDLSSYTLVILYIYMYVHIYIYIYIISMYGCTMTMAETIHRLKSTSCNVVRFLFDAVGSSKSMGSRLAFSSCAKRCTNWHSKISQCRCSLFYSARLPRQ